MGTAGCTWMLMLGLAAAPAPWSGTFVGQGGFPVRPGSITVNALDNGEAAVRLAFEDGGFNGTAVGTWEGNTLRFALDRVTCTLSPSETAGALQGTCTEILTVEGRAPISMPQAFTRKEQDAPWWKDFLVLPTPDGWKAAPVGDNAVELSSPDGAAHVTLRATNVHDDAPPLATVEKDVTAALRTRFKGAKVTRTSSTRLDGKPARRLDVSFKQDGTPMKMVVLVCVHPPLRVVVEANAPAAGFERRLSSELLPTLNAARFTR